MNSKISQIYKSDLKEIKELGQMAWVIDMNSLVVLTPGGLAFSKPRINNTAEIVVLQRKVDILDKSILSTNEGLAALGSGGSGGGGGSDVIDTEGDGTMFLADDGTYKEVYGGGVIILDLYYLEESSNITGTYELPVSQFG